MQKFIRHLTKCGIKFMKCGISQGSRSKNFNISIGLSMNQTKIDQLDLINFKAYRTAGFSLRAVSICRF